MHLKGDGGTPVVVEDGEPAVVVRVCNFADGSAAGKCARREAVHDIVCEFTGMGHIEISLSSLVTAFLIVAVPWVTLTEGMRTVVIPLEISTSPLLVLRPDLAGALPKFNFP